MIKYYYASIVDRNLYIDGIISCPYVKDNKLKDILILVPKTKMEIAN